MKTKTQKAKSGAKRQRPKPLRGARGYLARPSQIAELTLLECCVEKHARTLGDISMMLWSMSNKMHDIRENIRTGKAR